MSIWDDGVVGRTEWVSHDELSHGLLREPQGQGCHHGGAVPQAGQQGWVAGGKGEASSWMPLSLHGGAQTIFLSVVSR